MTSIELCSEKPFSRELNGILATLEMCDNSIASLSERLAQRKLEKQEWESMIRNHFRIRFFDKPMSESIKQVLSEDTKLASKLLQCDRGNIINFFAKTRLPRTYDNTVCLLNLDVLNDERINLITSELLRNRYNSCCSI